MKVFTQVVLSLVALFFASNLSAQEIKTSTKDDNYASIAAVKQFSYSPVNNDGTTFGPLQEICSYLGIDVEDKDGKITLSDGKTTMIFNEWSNIAVWNGKKIKLPYKAFNVFVNRPGFPTEKLVKQRDGKKRWVDVPTPLDKVTMVPMRLLIESFGHSLTVDNDLYTIDQTSYQSSDDHRVIILLDDHIMWRIEGVSIVKKQKVSPAFTGLNYFDGEAIPNKTVIVCNLIMDAVILRRNDFDADRKSFTFDNAPMDNAFHLKYGRWGHACSPSGVKHIGQDASHGCIRQYRAESRECFDWAYDYVVTHKRELHVYVTGSHKTLKAKKK